MSSHDNSMGPREQIKLSSICCLLLSGLAGILVLLAMALQETQPRVLVPLLIAAIALLLGSVASSVARYGLARRSIRAISIFIQAMSAGAFGTRAAAPASGEFAGLVVRLNLMAEKLQAAQQARQEMLANLAHDLRKPLGTMHAALEALQAGAAEDPAMRQRLMDGMAQQYDLLEALTTDLIRLARYQSGHFELRRSLVDLSQILAKVSLAFEAEMSAKEIDVQVRTSGAALFACVDEVRMTEVFINLFDNAAKFTPVRGSIRVSLTEEDGRISFRVANSGPSVSAEQVPLMFERYRRLVDETALTTPGMGLGLAIVKEIVEAHGGTVEAQARENQGPAIFFTLPSAQTCEGDDTP